jgi:uncharacterized protein YvpB
VPLVAAGGYGVVIVEEIGRRDFAMNQKNWSRILLPLSFPYLLFGGNNLPVMADSTEETVEEIVTEYTTTEETTTSTETAAETKTESVTTTTGTEIIEPNDEDMTLGDLNNDGIISVEDAVLVLEIYAKQSAGLENNLSPQQFFCADCNRDTVISVEDAVLLLEYYAKQAACLVTVSFSDYVTEQAQPITTTEVTTEATTETTTEITTVTPDTTTETETTTAIESTTETTTESITETTTETTTTTTESTTTMTTTTTLPTSLQLSVDCILQNDDPSLPTGCEATALTIALNYDGFAAEKTDIAKTYLPKMVFYTLNQIYYGADFQYVFPGDPATSYGYGCYAPAIVATANAYFTAQKNASYAENISGTNFTDLFSYLAEGRPVIFWATMSMKAPSTGSAWLTPDAQTVTWIKQEHCLVLTGYDMDAGTVQVADPLRGNVTYDMNLVAQRYAEMGKYAVVLRTTDAESAETEGVNSGSVYRLRNAESGLYMTVSDGKDANGTNLIQAEADGTTAQQFRIVYDTESNSYRLYAMCSSDGTNRVVDIVKLGGGVVSGCNAEIYLPVDAAAQTFVLIPQEDGTMLFSCRTNRSACLAARGTTAGTATGTGFYTDGNIVIQNHTGDNAQHWILEEVEE